MQTKLAGLVVGLALGLAIALGGFTEACVVALFGLGGWLVAKVLDGEVDLQQFLDNRRQRP
ncbi:MAG: hypothetical protein ABIS47_04225 [Acidimicrobiales bacterium]